MKAPLRIQRPVDPKADPTGDLLARLVKLIPGDAAALYMGGLAIMAAGAPATIPPGANAWLYGWVAFCLGYVIATRYLGTRDVATGMQPDVIHVIISSVAFVLYVLIYPVYLGDTQTLIWDILRLPTFALPLMALGFTAVAALYPGPPRQ